MDWKTLIPLITAGVGAAGTIAGRGSAERAAGRATEADLTMQRDRDRTDQYRVQQDAILTLARLLEQGTMDRARLGIEAPSARAKQTMMGDAMAGIQNVAPQGVPSHIPSVSFSGGLRPSLLGSTSRAAGSTLARDAYSALLSGKDVPAAMDPKSLLLTPPTETPLPQAGKIDSILNALSLIGGVAGSGGSVLGNFQNRTKPAIQSRPLGGMSGTMPAVGGVRY